MLQGELNTRGNLRGELTGGIFYGTMDYDELINKPSINSVELSGNKSLEDLGIIIPTKTSDLDNDSGFITSADVPTKTSDLTNDSGFITSGDLATVATTGDYDDLTNKPTIPTLTSQLTNDSGFITNASVPTMTSQLFNDSGYITSADIPTDVSAFNNDAGYLTSSDVAEVAISGDYNDLTNKPTIPDNLSDLNDTTITTPSNADLLAYDSTSAKWVNTDLKGTASGSIATFSNGGNDIPVSEFECEIVAQQASGTPTPDNPLAITGFSQADITVTDNDQISNLYTVAFGQTIYGGRLIYDGQWSIEATHGYEDLGNLNWNYNSGFTTFWSDSDIGAKRGIGLLGISDSYTCVDNVSSMSSIPNTNYIFCGYRDTDTNRLYIKNFDYTDAVAFKSAMNNHYICYELATPVIIPITSSTRVKTISGDNNIYSNTGDCEVKYFTNKADSLAELIKAFL